MLRSLDPDAGKASWKVGMRTGDTSSGRNACRVMVQESVTVVSTNVGPDSIEIHMFDDVTKSRRLMDWIMWSRWMDMMEGLGGHGG